MSIADIRREYALASLDVPDVDPDPVVQCRRWLHDAIAAELPEPNAMTLATATPGGRPSARIVLLKGLDHRGLVFFTDYRSRKAEELDANPQAALAIMWKEIERQVRVEGRAERVSVEESREYFRSRPRGARVGAWASKQSAVITGRAWLEDEVAKATDRFGEDEVPLPPHWGGYRVVPDMFEFWQGRTSRLHDRVRFRQGDAGWIIERLSP